MTRAEFIHRAVIEGMRRNAEDGEPVGAATLLAWAYSLADAIEKDGKAPWSKSNEDEDAILKHIADEAHRQGYLLGEGDGRKHAKEEAAALLRRLAAECYAGQGRPALVEVLGKVAMLKVAAEIIEPPDVIKVAAEIKPRCPRCFGTGLVTAGGQSVDCPECSGPVVPKYEGFEP